MRIRPRESSLSHPFTAASFVPPSQGERAAPWLDRAPNAVPTWLAAMLHDERNRSSTRDACDQLLPTTLRRRVPTSRSAIRRCHPCGVPPDAWRVSRRPTHFGCSRFRLFEAGVFFPRRRPTESSDAPVTAHRLPSGFAHEARLAFANQRRPPRPRRESGGVCEHATKTIPHDDAREGSPQVLMIRSAFHRTGDRSRLEGFPSLRFASARRPGLPVCCAHPRR